MFDHHFFFSPNSNRTSSIVFLDESWADSSINYWTWLIILSLLSNIQCNSFFLLFYCGWNENSVKPASELNIWWTLSVSITNWNSWFWTISTCHMFRTKEKLVGDVEFLSQDLKSNIKRSSLFDWMLKTKIHHDNIFLAASYININTRIQYR